MLRRKYMRLVDVLRVQRDKKPSVKKLHRVVPGYDIYTWYFDWARRSAGGRRHILDMMLLLLMQLTTRGGCVVCSTYGPAAK